MNVKVMSSNDVKQRWGEVMREITSPDDAVVVESHGKPKVAVISIERFVELRRDDNAKKRDADLNWLREFERSHQDVGQDLTEQEIEDLSVRAGREINRGVTTTLKLKAQRKQQ